ncbi:LysR family transcriptional regulator [Pseudobacillus wudalianchiensis]|uniref:Transcriptional regulator n=1 Tax=Pseudobacillus wudalianchiensis TaxID=1743143 RepID=A0A1B9B720_9BACI|nr:LysR family transcriptional regulator [Bacillus wudalianchiensis]OCA91896.1 transcriptional regulator [Bacillus wudalianchiensis]
MNIHALRLFTKVAELKSVSKAAEVLRISQPAVTIQIRNLEKEVGLTLTESKGRGITLTSNGDFLYKQAQRLFDLERDIENKVAQLKNSGADDLNIAASYVPANFLLPKWLCHYKETYPSVTVNVKTENTQQVIEQLLHYKADLAFVIEENRHHPDLHYQFLMNLEYCFIVPSHHQLAGQTISFEKLMNEPFILREKGSSTKDLLLALCNLHKTPPPKIGMQLYGLNESIRTVAAGFGAMLAPVVAIEDYLYRKQVAQVYVEDIEIKRPTYVCTRKNEIDVLPHVSHFIEVVKDQ